LVKNRLTKLNNVVLVKSSGCAAKPIVFVLKGFDLLIERCFRYFVVRLGVLFCECGRAGEDLADTIADRVSFSDEVKRGRVSRID
jgi:hypothetical protein